MKVYEIYAKSDRYAKDQLIETIYLSNATQYSDYVSKLSIYVNRGFLRNGESMIKENYNLIVREPTEAEKVLFSK